MRRVVRGVRVAVALVLLAAGVLVLAASGSAAPQRGANAPFEPFRSSFVSASVGFVLGAQGCSLAFVATPRPCAPVVMATTDGGADWERVSAPATRLFTADQELVQKVGGRIEATPYVEAITFADARDGWLYGPGLWATHDGGRHWAAIDVGGNQVLALVTAAGWAYATLAPVSTMFPHALLRSPVGRDDWQPVESVTSHQLDPPGPSTSFEDTAWVTLPASTQTESISVLWRTSDAAHWESAGRPCGQHGYVVAIAASSATDLVLDCGPGGAIVTSTDGGLHTQRVTGLPAREVFVDVIGAPPGERDTFVLAAPWNLQETASPPVSLPSRSELIRTTNAGRSFTATDLADHGAGFADLQFVSPTDGWVVHGYPGATVDQLMRTTDAGATFTPVALP
jgi:photosystem II stability/assembly factor-like uncharacterized protein